MRESIAAITTPQHLASSQAGCKLCRHLMSYPRHTAVSSEAWAKLRDWASVASRGWLLLSGSVAHASLKTAVCARH